MAAAEIRAVGTITTTTTAMASTSAMAKSVLPAIALIVAISGVLLGLPAATGNKRGQAAYILSAFLAALVRLRIGLLLVLRTILHLLVARWERLRVARQKGLLLRFARPVAWLVLTHERLIVVVVPIECVVAALRRLTTRRTLLMRLLIVVRVLLTKLLLRGGDQAEIVLCVLIIILSRHRVTGPLRVTCKLDVFFRNVRSGAADFNVGTVRFVNARERILAFAVIPSPPHALLTVSHVVPVRRPFILFRHLRRTLNSTCKPKQISLRGRTCTMSAPMIELLCPLSR